MTKEEMSTYLTLRLQDKPQMDCCSYALQELLAKQLPPIFMGLGLQDQMPENIRFLADLIFYALERDLQKMFHETDFLKEYVEQLLNVTPH